MQQRDESRGIQEIQYYDGRVGGEVNKIFSNMVNVEPYKCPRYQQGYLETLKINENEKGDKDFTFVKGRKGFKRIDVPSAFDGYEFVDNVIIGEEKKEFFLAISFDKKKAKIGEYHNGVIRDVTMLFYGFGPSDHFEFEKGLSEKITKTYFVGKNIRKIHAGAGTTVISSGIKRYQKDIGYYITDTDVDNGNNTYDSNEILPGDYIYIVDTGEVGTVTLVEPDKIRIDGVRKMDVGGTNPSDGLHTFAIFSERTDTFIFQTKAGPVTYHNLNNSTVQMFPGGSMYGGNLKISGMTVHQDNIYFIDRKSGRLYFGGNGIQQMVVTADGYSEVGHKFMWLDTFQDYIVMSGPEAIGAAYGVWTQVTKEKTMFNLRRQELIDYVGVRGEHAIKGYPEGIEMIGSDGLLYGLGITPTGTTTGILIPSLKPQSYYIVDDIKRLNKDANIYLNIDGMNVKIFINNLRYPKGSNYKNSKILIYDYHHRFWYKWMMKGIHINSTTKGGLWYGDGMFENTGKTDDGTKFKQIISAIFGEGYSLTGKYITMLKMLVGQNSKYTKGNTEIKVRFDNGGRSRSVRYDNLGSSEYVKYIMDIHNGGTIGQLPDGTVITDTNGVPGGAIATLNSEFEAYESYENTMKTELGYNYEEDLAKWGKIKLEITAYADVVYIDLISKNGDNIDFGGFLLGFGQTDADTERLSDTLGIEN